MKMKVKKLILVRHGDYDENDQLSSLGCLAVLKAAIKLKKEFNGDSIRIISSNQDRAWQSADIIAKEFGVTYETNELLWSEKKHPEDLAGLFSFLEQQEDETILLVTHLEYVEFFPYYLTKKIFDKGVYSETIEKGGAIIINTQSGKFEYKRN